MARVEITTAGHSIVVDADGDLHQIAGKALYLWTRTRDPRLDHVYGPVGFHLERGDGTHATGHDVDLSHPTSLKGRDGL